MGRYSRKDMIEFAKFAKSYQSSRNVEEAYNAYLKGDRLVSGRDESILRKITKANKVFLNGNVVKDKINLVIMTEIIPELYKNVIVERWNSKTKVLTLITQTNDCN